MLGRHNSLMCLKPVLITAAFLFFSSSVVAVEIIPPKNTFEFSRDYIESLRLSLQGMHPDRLYFRQSSPEETEEAKRARLAATFVAANRALEKAITELLPYKESKHDQVRTIFFGTLIAFQTQIKINADRFEMLGEVGDLSDNDSSNYREFEKRNSALEAKAEENLELLINSSVMLTYVLSAGKPNRDGTHTTFAVTEKERKKLVSQLTSGFGKQLEGEFKPGTNFAVAPAQIIKKSLTRKGWSGARRKY